MLKRTLLSFFLIIIVGQFFNKMHTMNFTLSSRAYSYSNSYYSWIRIVISALKAVGNWIAKKASTNRELLKGVVAGASTELAVSKIKDAMGSREKKEIEIVENQLQQIQNVLEDNNISDDEARDLISTYIGNMELIVIKLEKLEEKFAKDQARQDSLIKDLDRRVTDIESISFVEYYNTRVRLSSNPYKLSKFMEQMSLSKITWVGYIEDVSGGISNEKQMLLKITPNQSFNSAYKANIWFEVSEDTKETLGSLKQGDKVEVNAIFRYHMKKEPSLEGVSVKKIE